MRIALALLFLSLPAAYAQTKDATPSPPLPPRVYPSQPSKDAAAVKFEKFELKDTKLINALRVIRAKAYNQGELIDVVLVDPKNELGERMVNLKLLNVTVDTTLGYLAALADFNT